jgi:adenylate kinase family enzyme
MPCKIVVVGTSGSGKSTLAHLLSEKLHINHIELDAIHWQKNWRPAPLKEFRKRVQKELKAKSWVADGNYSDVRDLVWPQASILIWLDYPFYFVFWRAFARSIRLIFTHQPLCGENYESFRRLFFSRESILFWVIQTYNKRKREIPLLLKRKEHRHLKVVHLRTHRDLVHFLDKVSLKRPFPC